MNEVERHCRALELFKVLCDLSAAERTSVLATECGGDRELRRMVESMLSLDGVEDAFVDAGESGRIVAEIVCDEENANQLEMAPEQIGPYRIIRKIGEGGMGLIYEAEQESPRRRVALKVLRPRMIGRSILKRFEYEAHVLGQLQHPGIAQVFEAGIEQTPKGSWPYLVMEYIHELPLDQFATTHNLDSKQRLELIARVCDAVHHAHQNGIIHRDLKPSNILVVASNEATPAEDSPSTAAYTPFHDSIGQPKVLDFGIARMTESNSQSRTLHTEIGQLVGTLAYMSPEQVEANAAGLDTRCDVYALGIVLYELLADRRPHDVSKMPMHEALRSIREDDLPRLGTIDRKFRGDVETIVAKAIEKEKRRRYSSAAELAADIRKYLRDQPIDARPASAFYHLSKYSKRNRGLVTGIVMTFVALVSGIIGVSYFLIEATNQRNEARRAQEIAERTAEFQAARLKDIDASMMGVALRNAILDAAPNEKQIALTDHIDSINFTDITLDLLDQNIFRRSITAIDSQFSQTPLVQAQLLATVAFTMQELGLIERAESPYRRALAIRSEHLGSDAPETLETLNMLGGLLVELGEHAEGENCILTALETGNRVMRADDRRLYQFAANRVALLFIGEQFEEAIPTLEQNLARQRNTLDSDDEILITTLINLGSAYLKTGRFGQAARVVQEAVETVQRAFDEPTHQTHSAHNNLGVLLRAQGKLVESEKCFGQAVEIGRAVFGTNHIKTIISMNNHASALYRVQRIDEGEALLKDAADIIERSYGTAHRRFIVINENLGFFARSRGELNESIRYYMKALALRRDIHGENMPNTLLAMKHVGDILIEAKRIDEAASIYEEVVNGAELIFGKEHENTIGVMQQLIQLLNQLGRTDDADKVEMEPKANRIVR